MQCQLLVLSKDSDHGIVSTWSIREVTHSDTEGMPYSGLLKKHGFASACEFL